jgi:hypothetical protein
MRYFPTEKRADLRGHVTGGLARYGMFGQEFKSCRDPLNDAVRDTYAGAARTSKQNANVNL